MLVLPSRFAIAMADRLRVELYRKMISYGKTQVYILVYKLLNPLIN